jgi:NAD(P)-dependent dehydrogenase (short-subunit alcohol dehydrogenase family)
MFRGRPRKDLIRHHGALAERALEGMNIAIVGGTNGIGRALASAVLAKGAKVKVVGRTFRDAPTSGPSFVAADLGSMAAARRVAQDLSASSLDILVFTNGVMAGRQRRVTSEGIEYDLAVSYPGDPSSCGKDGKPALRLDIEFFGNARVDRVQAFFLSKPARMRTSIAIRPAKPPSKSCRSARPVLHNEMHPQEHAMGRSDR